MFGPYRAPRVGTTTGEEKSVMRSAGTWFVILASVCIIGPYMLGVRPRTRRHWVYVALTVAFLAWLLPLMISLRSR